MQEAQGASAAGDRTGILRLPVSEQDDPVAVRCADHRQRMFSVLLYPHGASCPWAPTSSRPYVGGAFEGSVSKVEMAIFTPPAQRHSG